MAAAEQLARRPQGTCGDDDEQRGECGDVAFVGPDGAVYDAQYRRVYHDAVAPLGEFSDVPSTEKFMSFTDYETAVLQWKAHVEQRVGCAQLPAVMGRHYNRPMCLSGQHKASFDSGEGTPRRRASTVSGVSDEEDFQWLPLKVDPWEAVLYPKEPLPSYYETFAQYESAMRRWAALFVGHVLLVPPHASQLESLAELHPENVAMTARTTATVPSPSVSEGARVLINTARVCYNPHVALKNGIPVAIVVVDARGFAPLRCSSPLSQHVVNELHDCFRLLLRNRKENWRKFQTYNEPLQRISGAASQLAIPTSFDYRKIPSATQIGAELEKNRCAAKLTADFNAVLYAGRNERDFGTAADPDESAAVAEALCVFTAIASSTDVVTLLQRLVLLPLSVTTFAKLIGDGDGQTGQVRSAALCDALLPPNNLQRFLSLWDYSTSRATRQKIVEVVNRVMHCNHCGSEWLLSQLRDTRLLHALARCAAHSAEVPAPLFPYDQTALDLIALVVDRNTMRLVTLALSLYYVRALCEHLNLPAAVAVLADPAVFGTTVDGANVSQLVRCLGSRCIAVSAVALVALLYLARIPHTCILDHLKTHEFIGKIRGLFRSKHSHTRYACQRILRVFTHAWRSLFFQYYTQNSEFIIEDIVDPHVPDDVWRTLVRGHAGALRAHTEASSDAVAFLLGDRIYQHILGELQSTADSAHRNERMEGISVLLEMICQCSYEWNLIRCSPTNPKRPGLGGGKELSISAADVMRLMGIVMLKPEAKLINSHILRALSYLLRPKAVFDTVDVVSLVTQLQPLCRDPQRQLNRSAWRLFYDSVKHHAGLIERLDKKAALLPLLDCVSSGGGVTANALHYVGKMFNLHRLELNRVASGLTAHRALVAGTPSAATPTAAEDNRDVRSARRDVKQLAEIFRARRLFIMLHMIYKRADKQQGAVFAVRPAEGQIIPMKITASVCRSF
eukprot:TRINITY_DN1399_c0_g1_i6.p1 TRINITY_DN1399_c0_g1~~TRINITY_DN1399_c0_g1_i6.p1  ORF type:complete len:968 (-),score=152.90 TRINITY_DN1399_c0_g1_i6:36-2918(-)